MSTTRTQQYFDSLGTGLTVIETGEDTSTVGAAAAALGVQPGQIAKTLAVRAGDQVFLLVTRGDARLDNRKFKEQFGAKPRMLPLEETAELTGQPVGGNGAGTAPVSFYLFDTARGGSPSVIATYGKTAVQDLAWSPDGSAIAWAEWGRNRYRSGHLFLMPASGGDSARLPGWAIMPAWAPGAKAAAKPAPEATGTPAVSPSP